MALRKRMNSWKAGDAAYLALQHVQRGEQRGGAVALVIVGHRGAAPLLHRQARLAAVERLNLALHDERQHDRIRRRIDPRVRPMAGPRTGSEADDVVELVG